MARPLPVEFVRGVVRLEDLPAPPLPEIACSGRSNVGKSSLLNAVFGRKGLARVSRTPGRTREINFFAIGGRYHLVDLPGYGYARVPAATKRTWSELVRGYLEGRRQLAGVVQLVDARHGPTALDREMLDWLRGAELAALVVATKIDKVKRSQIARTVRQLEQSVAGFPLAPFSAMTGEGHARVRNWIDATVSGWNDR